MIDHINTRTAKHIVTIEDPIEFLHVDKKSVINQREVGQDTLSFKRALRRVLRQDPDVILIGEMRDEETVHTALSAAETGHLVLSTVHTVDAAETVNRIIDFFPPHMEGQIRAMLAGTLKGVVSQRLVRSTDGGRVATCEIMRMTGRVRDMIMDPAQTGRLTEVVSEGAYYGMQTFDQALFDHVKAGRVDVDQAMLAATSPHDFKLLLAADGKRGTTMEDVIKAEAQRAACAAPDVRRPAASLQSVKCWAWTTHVRSARPPRSCAESGRCCSSATSPRAARASASSSARSPGISPRTLSLRLRALEEEGIVERDTYPEVPPRVEYQLTEKGRALLPIIDDMRTYGTPLARRALC